MWHKCVSMVVLNYNISYRANNGCEPSRVLNGRIPYNVRDIKMGIRPQKIPTPVSQKSPKMCLNKRKLFSKISAEIPCRLTSKTKRNMIKKPMPQNSNKQTPFTSYSQKQQGGTIPFTDFRWIGPFIIEKVLPKNSYLIRKIGTNKTQVLHRTRLSQLTPRQPIPDTQISPRE